MSGQEGAGGMSDAVKARQEAAAARIAAEDEERAIAREVERQLKAREAGMSDLRLRDLANRAAKVSRPPGRGQRMTCQRCGDKEDRIDDFCSVYCRDMWEVEAELAEARGDADRLAEALETLIPDDVDNYADEHIDNARAALFYHDNLARPGGSG